MASRATCRRHCRKAISSGFLGAALPSVTPAGIRAATGKCGNVATNRLQTRRPATFQAHSSGGTRKQHGRQTLETARTSGVPLTAAPVSSSAVSRGGGKGQWREAVTLLKETWKRGEKPRVHSYSFAINACAKSGRWETAIGLLREMSMMGIAPDAISYNAAIKACARRGRWEEAVGLLREVLAAAEITPDPISYNSAIDACAKAGRWEEAVALLREMPGMGLTPDVISYGSAIDACGKGGRWEEAVGLLREMPSRGVTPNAVT